MAGRLARVRFCGLPNQRRMGRLTHLLLGAVIGAVIGWFLGSIGPGAIIGAVIAGGIHWMRGRGSGAETRTEK